MNDTDTPERLRERREALEARLAAIRADLGRGLDPDSEERAVQLENHEVLAEIARVTGIELERVEAQLAELEQERPGRGQGSGRG